MLKKLTGKRQPSLRPAPYARSSGGSHTTRTEYVPVVYESYTAPCNTDAAPSCSDSGE